MPKLIRDTYLKILYTTILFSILLKRMLRLVSLKVFLKKISRLNQSPQNRTRWLLTSNLNKALLLRMVKLRTKNLSWKLLQTNTILNSLYKIGQKLLKKMYQYVTKNYKTKRCVFILIYQQICVIKYRKNFMILLYLLNNIVSQCLTHLDLIC